MWIGLDASRATRLHRTGTENYARRLIGGLVAHSDGRHRFTLYLRDAPGTDIAGLLPDSGAVEARFIPFPRLWTHVRLSWELLRRPRPDVLFVPAHVLPVVHPLRSVVTVHDLGYRHFPQAHAAGQRLYLDWSTRFSARRSSLVMADSQATRRDLLRFYDIPDGKIRVVYPGRDERLGPTDPGPVRARYGLPDRYVLHVGTLQPRKNLVRLIEATARLSQQMPDLRLVLAGRAGWLAEPILAQARAHGDLVRLLDYVPDEDLAGLYSGAAVFAFPSLYEGFGFPVLEAMACGTPVVCANTSSLPELAGEAALLVDPGDVDALAAALGRVLADRDLRESLVDRGRQQVRLFSWERTAKEALAVLEEAAAMRRAPVAG
jgi:glycosyltransferase involved in cell wall biosynthesis